MSTGELSGPPILSTPDAYILTETAEPMVVSQRVSDEELFIRYEITRTVEEIRSRKWRRVALQFPDSMLGDSVRVYRELKKALSAKPGAGGFSSKPARYDGNSVREDRNGNEKVHESQHGDAQFLAGPESETSPDVKLTILGDTSYGSCCVDEIAAEHIDVEAVVHYGRSCLSPTARLPVLYVFTEMDLDHSDVCETFKSTLPQKDDRIIVTADTPFARHVEMISSRLREDGYTNIFAAAIIHDPSSLIPNRTIPEELKQDSSLLGAWSLFHISDPPTSLLLTLSSRMKSVQIYSILNSPSHQANTSVILRRRYALVTSLSTVSTWGVLINTLSVKNYLHIVDHVKKQIADAGKKSYVFVVGKLNAAKVANFAEIGGWVVIGCWESSLVDSRDFYKPIITPYELELVLKSEDERVWTGEWRGDFQKLLDQAVEEKETTRRMPGAFDNEDDDGTDDHTGDYDSEEESAPPEFDLRTGKYVSHSRPMKSSRPEKVMSVGDGMSTAITKRSNGDILSVKGVSSPAAEFLAQKRTWRGLGSDFEIKYDEEEEQGGLVEEGRTGVARGYQIADSKRS